eukprot:15337736-Ditylum_brightwellii.AAC.1
MANSTAYGDFKSFSNNKTNSDSIFWTLSDHDNQITKLFQDLLDQDKDNKVLNNKMIHDYKDISKNIENIKTAPLSKSKTSL